MPYKPTGGRNGRPPKSSRGALFVFDPPQGDGLPRYRLNAPPWWIAMAEMEAQMVVAGRWGLRGHASSLRRLAREFTTEVGGGKSPAAITKARTDEGYVRYRDRRVAELRVIAEQDRRQPQKAIEHRTRLRADISDAIDEVMTKKPRR